MKTYTKKVVNILLFGLLIAIFGGGLVWIFYDYFLNFNWSVITFENIFDIVVAIFATIGLLATYSYIHLYLEGKRREREYKRQVLKD